MLLIEDLDLTTPWTRLDLLMLKHGIKPAVLAREAGINRQHFLRTRKAVTEPTRLKIVQIASAFRRLTHLPIEAPSRTSRRLK